MSDLHQCAGIMQVGQKIVICACVSQDMYHALDKHYRKKILSEVQAFAGDYHHHIEGRDVVIVEQLLDFLTPVEGKEQDGLGTTG